MNTERGTNMARFASILHSAVQESVEDGAGICGDTNAGVLQLRFRMTAKNRQQQQQLQLPIQGSLDAERATNSCITLCIEGSLDAKRATNSCITLCIEGSLHCGAKNAPPVEMTRFVGGVVTLKIMAAVPIPSPIGLRRLQHRDEDFLP